MKICTKVTGKRLCWSVISINGFAALLKSHFSMDVLLWICCKFLEYLPKVTSLGGLLSDVSILSEIWIGFQSLKFSIENSENVECSKI